MFLLLYPERFQYALYFIPFYHLLPEISSLKKSKDRPIKKGCLMHAHLGNPVNLIILNMTKSDWNRLTLCTGRT